MSNQILIILCDVIAYPCLEDNTMLFGSIHNINWDIINCLKA